MGIADVCVFLFVCPSFGLPGGGHGPIRHCGAAGGVHHLVGLLLHLCLLLLPRRCGGLRQSAGTSSYSSSRLCRLMESRKKIIIFLSFHLLDILKKELCYIIHASFQTCVHLRSLQLLSSPPKHINLFLFFRPNAAFKTLKQ